MPRKAAARSLSSSFRFFEQLVEVVELRGFPELVVAVGGLHSHVVLGSSEGFVLRCNEVWILLRRFVESASMSGSTGQEIALTC